MNSVMSFFQKLPRPLVFALCAAVVTLVGWLLYRVVFPPEPPVETAQSVTFDFPQASDEGLVRSRMDELQNPGRQSVSDYWDRLETRRRDSVAPVSHAASPAVSQTASSTDASQADLSQYSEMERYNISHGVLTPEQVEAARRRQEREEAEDRRRDEQRQRALEAERERRMESVRQSYQTAAVQTQGPSPASEPQPEPEPRRLETTQAVSLSGGGVITSLDDTPLPDAPAQGGGTPCRVTFLKNEKIVSGQRVVMRLLQDLTLRGGETIPANTHLTGICTVADRLEIKITTVNYANRIYYTTITAYDGDGLEGIYCPVIVDSGARRSGKNLGREVGNTLAEVVGAAAGVASSHVGSLARRGVYEVTQSIDDSGNVSVSVSAGYEFLVREEEPQ